MLEASFSQETYTETRDITDSAGNTFSCLYTIVYDPSRKVFSPNLVLFCSARVSDSFFCKVVYRRQSSVQCDPDTNGKQTTEDIIIAVSCFMLTACDTYDLFPINLYNIANETHIRKNFAVSIDWMFRRQG